jgi:hypothetical protein
MIEKLKNINAKLVNYLIMSIGIILIIISVNIGTNIVLGQILISTGTSLLASTIVVLISSKYLFKQNEIKKIIEKWGITGIYRTRAHMNEFTNIDLEKNINKLDIIAFGLKSFRHSKGEFIKLKVKQGMKIRILTIDPNSSFLSEREKVEECIDGEIRETIKQLTMWIESLKKYQVSDNQVEIKFYNSLPLDFYFGLDNSIYIGPYLFGIDSQQTISYSFKYNTEGYDYYSIYFEKLWNNSEFCSVSKNIQSEELKNEV